MEVAPQSLSPSDLTVFLSCRHAIALELNATPKPADTDPQVELIRRKGEEHERAYLANLRAQGETVQEIDFAFDWDAATTATVRAISDGFDVVYQGAFVAGRWRGFADFLERQPDGTYEVVDTKLARHAKPAYILQLCFYNEQLARIQGIEPKQIHVVLGNGDRTSFRPEEFGAYYRRVRRRLEAFADNPPKTEPWPNEHCGVCGYKPLCDARWDAIDHLSRVAGITRTQIEKLVVAGITSLAELGRAGVHDRPAGVSSEVWTKIQEQASLQLESRETGEERRVLLTPKPGSGFALLPDPSPGDLFFDFEGNPFWDSDGSLEYLWGMLDHARNFTAWHAESRDEERARFEEFIDFVHARLREYPDMHVYHYAQYEITALRRMMGRYGTRESELDDLLRRGVFVDLLAVVRNGIRASRPSYSLKALEVFLDFERRADIKEGGTSIVVFERYLQTHDHALLAQIDAYNEEDCVATMLLRDWLLELRAEVIERFGPFPAVVPVEAKPIPPAVAERERLRQELMSAGESVAGELLEYHRREEKPVWWAFFDRLEKTDEELLEDAEAIARLEPVGEPEVLPRPKRSSRYHFSFPAQESKVGTGQEVVDPVTGKTPGTVAAVDREAGTLVLERATSRSAEPLPRALIPGGPYATKDQKDALARFARSLLDGGSKYPALESILRRTPFERNVQTTDLDEMKALVRSLDGRHLVIQGPPGSGKTWTSGRLIADLISHGKTVGVASTSHKAIHKLLDEVEATGVEFHGLKKASEGNPESEYVGKHVENVWSSDECAGSDLTAGTAWHFARAEHDQTLDYLFIDEAGQVSLADAIAMGTSARNIVLVGDPQQLAQVSQGSHPLRTEASVLAWLLGDDATIPPDRGLFLERTFRLHPDVCRYISDEFYEGRLVPDPITETRTTPFGTGLRFVEVGHDGNRQSSPEEVAAVKAIVRRLRDGGVHDVKVVAPYNMHVNRLREALPGDVPVGTVDKFQGQEADVVIYSMASSSVDDVPRGLEFLLSRNRLNVAISRARCLAYLVASPGLLEVNARTIDQMRLANALCRFVEDAQVGSLEG